jgi:lactoylglutathione lyase
MSETVAAPANAAATAPSPPRFGFVKFVVADLDLMRDFYERCFGLRVAYTIEQPDFTELFLRRPGEEAGFSLVLFWYRNGPPIELGSAFGPFGFFARDVDATYAHALKGGAASHMEPYDAPGMRVAFVLDPEGRKLEIVSLRP